MPAARPKPSLLRLPRASRLFLRYFSSYSLILLIPFCIGAALYSSSVRVIESSATRSAQAILEQTRDIVDTRIAELDATARQLTLSQQCLSVLAMGRLEEGSPSYYALWSFWQGLPDYSLANSFISAFYIIPRRAGVVVSARQVRADDEAQYERELKYRDWSYEAWRSYLFGRQRNRAFLLGASPRLGATPSRGLYYVQSLPIESGRSPAGALVVFIDEASVAGLLKRLDTGERGLVLIADGEGELVASIAGAECGLDAAAAARAVSGAEAAAGLARLARAGYIVSRAVSGLSGWSYVSILPTRTVLAEARRVRDASLALLAAGLGLGLGSAAFLARRSAAPIRAIARKLTGLASPALPEPCRDEIQYLGQAFEGLMADDEGLRAELARQSPVVRADVTRRLLLGLYGNEREAFALARSAGLELEARRFSAAAIRIEGYRELGGARALDELKVLRAAIAEALRAARGFEALSYEEEEDLVGVLFSFPAAEPAAFLAEPLLAEASEALAQGYRARLAWATGGEAASAAELPVAYLRARRALASPRPAAEGRAPGLPAPAAAGEDPFWFPIEAELRLVAAIRGADAAGLGALLREAEAENLEARALADPMFRDFAAAFRVAVLRGFCPGPGGRGSPEAAELARALTGLDESDRRAWFARAGSVLGAFLELLASERTSERRELAAALAARIGELYPDPSLTLYALAREFELSESSLYHFFRDAFGRSFADYLEGLRIREACSRLSAGGAAIKEVAAAVGFASDTTFRRAFHRVVGASPSEYAAAARNDRS